MLRQPPIKAADIELIVNRLKMASSGYLPIGLAHTAADTITTLWQYLLKEWEGKYEPPR
jgi:hypothetical protein